MQMSMLTFYIDSTCLFYHTIVIMHILYLNAAYIVQTLFELYCRYRLSDELFPTSTMDQHAFGKIGLITTLLQLLIEVLPDHKGKSEQEDGLSLMLFKEGFHALYIEFHVLIKCIHTLAAKHRKTQNASTSSREHPAILHHARRIQNNHRHALIAKQ